MNGGASCIVWKIVKQDDEDIKLRNMEKFCEQGQVMKGQFWKAN